MCCYCYYYYNGNNNNSNNNNRITINATTTNLIYVTNMQNMLYSYSYFLRFAMAFRGTDLRDNQE